MLELPIINRLPATAGLLHLDGPGSLAARSTRPARPTVAARPRVGLLELPEIETTRLRLRVCVPSDLAALAAIMSQPQTFRYSERGAMGVDETWGRLLRHYGHWSLFGYGPFAVEEKLTGALVGEVGFGDFRREFGRGFDALPEAFWTLSPDVWGRGYAVEAAAAAHDWLCASRHSRQTVCLIHRDNARSIRVAHRLGYHCFAARQYRGYHGLLFKWSADLAVALPPHCADVRNGSKADTSLHPHAATDR